jgi:peptide deformylase
VYVTLTRAAEVVVAFTDLDGRERTARATGLLARVIQHEMDHLNGVLLVDRMSLAQKFAVAGKLRRLKQRAEAA